MRLFYFIFKNILFLSLPFFIGSSFFCFLSFLIFLLPSFLYSFSCLSLFFCCYLLTPFFYISILFFFSSFKITVTFLHLPILLPISILCQLFQSFNSVSLRTLLRRSSFVQLKSTLFLSSAMNSLWLYSFPSVINTATISADIRTNHSHSLRRLSILNAQRKRKGDKNE